MRVGKRRMVAVVGGAGAMGRAVVYDLARQGLGVRLIETDAGHARAVARRYGRGRAAVVPITGGADFTPDRPALSFGFSPATLLDELSQRPMVFTRGRFRSAPPLSGAEEFRFDLGPQRVHLSLHSEVATLPVSLAGKGVRECAF